MNKFCTKCGTKLENGICKNCDIDSNGELLEEYKVNNNILNSIIIHFKEFIRNPIDTVKEYSNKNNFNIGLGLIVVNALTFGIMFHIMIVNILNKVGIDITNVINMINQWFIEFTSNNNVNFSIDLGEKLIVGNILVSIIMILVITLISKYIFNKKVDYKEITTMIGLNEIILIIANLFATLISFINPIISIICYLLFMIIFTVLLVEGIKNKINLNSKELLIISSLTLITPIFAIISLSFIILFINLIVNIIINYSKNTNYIRY